MRMMADYDICPTIHGEPCLCAILCRGIALVRHTPMESNYYPTNQFLQRKDIGRQSFLRIHRASGQFPASRSATIPVITQQSDLVPPREEDARFVCGLFVHPSANGNNTRGLERLK